MKNIKKFIALVLAVLMMASLLTACAGSSSGDNGGTGGSASTAVTVGYIGTHQATHPATLLSNDFITQMMIYDKLFEVDDNTGEHTSRVLESWEWVDSVTFRATLKDNIYFSDGKQMTGEDVLYTMESYIDQPGSDKYTYKVIDFEKSYVSEDGLTFYLIYSEEYGPAFNDLDCFIMQKEFTAAHDEADTIWFTDPVGSGPYKITNCVMDSSVTFTLRDNYWNTDYSYDVTELTIRFYSDETAMYADFQNGVIDVAYGISSSICEQIENSGSGTVKYVSNNDVSVLCLNEDNVYLADPAVREAIAHALDMNAIADIAYGKLYVPAKSHFGTAFSCYTEHEGYSYDVEYAKKVLADAGYADGEIVLEYVAMSFAPNPQVAEAVQGYLSAVGINVNVYAYDLPTTLNVYINGETDISIFENMAGNPTLEPRAQVSVSSESSSFKCMSISDQTLNSYLRTGLNTVDRDIQNEAYRAVDDWLYDNFHFIPVCETLAAYAYNSRIAAFNQSAVGRGCLGSMKLSK